MRIFAISFAAATVKAVGHSKLIDQTVIANCFVNEQDWDGDLYFEGYNSEGSQ